MAQANCLAHLTECPVCFERLLPPVDTCIKGHAVCQDCRKEVRNCPTCRGEFSKNQNVLLNQMLESVPVACKNKSSGCNQRMLLKQLVKHEKMCSYREENCCFCEKKLSLFFFDEHLSNQHSRGSTANVIYVNLYQTFRIQVNATELGKNYRVLIYNMELQTHFIIRWSLEVGNKMTLSMQYSEECDWASYFYEMRIDQKLPFDGPRAIFTCFGFCVPYSYSYSDWIAHKRAITLDLNQIFLSEHVPQEFVMSFQIKQCCW